ncbi:hypothetical protein OSTOST_21863 [Ostertagia ostertagi]
MPTPRRAASKRFFNHKYSGNVNHAHLRETIHSIASTLEIDLSAVHPIQSMTAFATMFLLWSFKTKYKQLRGDNDAISCARHLPSDTDEEELPEELNRLCHKEENGEMIRSDTTQCLLMKPKRMEWLLSDLRSFENPNISLEQYATSPELAISIVDSIDRLVGFDGRIVADLGCGCGMLMSAIAIAHQPAAVVGVDIDEHALSICREKISKNSK